MAGGTSERLTALVRDGMWEKAYRNAAASLASQWMPRRSKLKNIAAVKESLLKHRKNTCREINASTAANAAQLAVNTVLPIRRY